MGLNLPIQAPQFTKADLEDPALPLLNQFLLQVSNRLNSLAGHAGPIQFANSIDMNGNPILNAGVPSDPNGVVTVEFALKNYGPAAITPQLEATGNKILQTTRRLNDTIQRETYSSFLNGVLNTAPTANTANISATTPSGGSIVVTVSAGYHQRVDGSQVPFSSRSDTLSVPSAFSYTSATRTSNNVVVVTPSPSGVVLGEALALGGAGDPTFDGFFVVSKIDSTTQFEYVQNGPNGSTSGGGYTPINIYYYTIAVGQTTLGLMAATGADSWSNRVAASKDGTTIIAVAAIAVSGLDIVNSAAGNTPPQSGANIPVIRRI